MPATPLDLRQIIRNIPDFPKPGIMFRDITPLIAHPEGFRQSVQMLADQYRDHKPTVIVAAEARGFIFAAPLAIELGCGFVPVRKPGKLPYKTHSFKYELEYGQDALHLHTDALKPGDRALLVDDLLATGGTMGACIHLVKECQAEVIGCAFVVELTFLPGRQKLAPYDVFSLVQYADET